MVELSAFQVWLLLTAAILAGGGCYSAGVAIGTRMARKAANRAYVAGSDDVRWSATLMNIRADYRVFRLVGYGRVAAAFEAMAVAFGLRP